MATVKVEPGTRLPFSPLGVVSTPTWDSPWCGRLERGDLVTIHGRRGRWSFYEHTRTPADQEWVTVYGGDKNPLGSRQFTSAAPNKIRKAKR